MIAIRQAFLGGTAGIRPSMFAGSANDPFVSLGAAWMGQTGQQWYGRAQQAVARYDQWIEQARKIANAQAREAVLDAYYGDPNDEDSALYRRNSVARYIDQAEGFTPVNYNIFEKASRQERIVKLEEWNSDLRSATKDAIAMWGELPEPVIIERLVPGETPKWFWPAAIGLGGIAIAAALGAFSK